MSKKFDVITIVLMIMLGSILVGVIFSYFLKSNATPTSKIDSPMNIINTDNIYSGDKVIIISNQAESGNTYQEDNPSVLSGDSGEIIVSPQKIPNDSTNSMIISTGDISSSEKKEVLRELDQTLMELFDIVDMVTTVDETRLIIEESGEE